MRGFAHKEEEVRPERPARKKEEGQAQSLACGGSWLASEVNGASSVKSVVFTCFLLFTLSS